LQKLGLEEGEAIVHPWINKALEKAQQKVEARNFDARKNILKYDDVMNDQRKVIFEQRIGIMKGEDVSGTIEDMRHEVIDTTVEAHIPPKAYPEQWRSAELHEKLREVVAIDFPVEEWAAEEGIADEEIRERVTDAANNLYAKSARSTATRSWVTWKRKSSCARSTSCGANTSSRWSTCARLLRCAATASAIRSTSTSRKALPCSSRWWRACANSSPAS
jgi:preprotein translocase subunit SecA